MDVKKKVVQVVVKQLNVSEDKVTLESKFVDDLGADSLDIVELTMGLEDEFGVSISDKEAEKLVSVGDVVSFIEKS